MIPFPFFSSVIVVVGSQSFTTVGVSVFTVPAGITSIQIECIGAGGNGGAQTTIERGAGGGGGGAYSSSTITVTPGATYSVVVGLGGNATYGAAVPGGDSYFNNPSTVMAKGGSSCAVNVRGYPTRILGGQASASVGTTKYSGGMGGWSNTTPTPNSGGGGGAAGPGGAGGNATSETVAPFTKFGGVGQSPGGNGADGSYDVYGNSTPGVVGFDYGGGGSGAFRRTVNMDGGSGANGWVRVTWLFTS